MAMRPEDPTREGAHDAAADGSRPVARFEVRYSQILDHTGAVVGRLPKLAREPRALIPLYRAMVLTRLFDAKAVALQRTGQLGTYPSSLGQEATAVGLGAALESRDVLLPFYRDTGTQFMRGVRMTDILLYWGGDERGMAYEGPVEDFPISVPIATHAPHAVGVAYALKHRAESRAAVCSLGDGATSKGDFYEALNAAGVWQLPLIFLVTNNQWAISVPRCDQSHAETLAQKAIAAGIEGEQVDGNDVLAVYETMRRALARARAGGGPHLIEALTYRIADHTTADDASRYRDDAEVSRQRALDPIDRVRKYLTAAGAWSDADESTLEAECRLELEEGVKEYLATPARAPDSMFDHLFEALPAALEAQRDEVKKGGSRG